MATADRAGPRSPTSRDIAAERATLALAFMLLALAGWVDAVGFVRWSQLYVSFMSGNTTELGAAAAVSDGGGAARAGGAVGTFVVGVVLGELVGAPAGRWRGPAVVSLEAALLWLAAAAAVRGWGDAATAAAAGLAMGVQTAAVHEVDGVSVALTYVTGTLVNLGRGVAAALRGEKRWTEALPFAGLWLSLLAGAVGGGHATRAGVDVAIVAAAATASALAVYSGAVAGLRKG